MKKIMHIIVIAILGAGFNQCAFSLIVWDGMIVDQWPDPVQPFLRKAAKGTAVLPLDSGANGFGFYTRPTDTIRSLTMIIDFIDQPADFTYEQVKDWLNKPGFNLNGANGSVRDYYHECSNGKLILINDVAGYYRAKKSKAYYENQSNYTGATELVNEVITFFDPYINFSVYDNDGNGITESINFVYAGSGITWGKGLWPHAGNIDKKCDNTIVSRYSMSDMGKSLGLYVFCHELGHMLFGWPDLYWFGDYCIMGNRMSEMNPQAVNDFFRADQGWISTIDITSSDNKEFVAWHNSGGFRFINPAAPGEMYFWSVVNNAGRWSNTRGKGILMYHFTKSNRGNTAADKRVLYVVEADGNNMLAASQWPDPGEEPDDFFQATTTCSFSKVSVPASSWGLTMYNICRVADTMSFSVGNGAVATMLPLVSMSVAGMHGENTCCTYDLLGRLFRNRLAGPLQGHQPTAGCRVSHIKGMQIQLVP